MTEILPAAKWGRDVEGNAPKLVVKNVREMTVHYTGAPKVSVARTGVAAHIKRIERQHQARPGEEKCSTIAYNFIIDKWGRIWEGRGWTYMNAANGARPGHASSNPVSFSVLVLVGVEDNKPTPEIVAALQDLYALACKRLRRKLSVQGHRDHIATSCPGDSLYRLVRSGRIESGKPAGVAKTAAETVPGAAGTYQEGSAPENATPAPLSDGLTHTVAAGETYWQVAKRYLGTGSRWTEISELNGDVELCEGLTIKVPVS